jgi:hypothetical protein
MQKLMTGVDRSLAVFVAVLAVVINVGLHWRPDATLSSLAFAVIPLGFGLVPAILLWQSSTMSMAGLTLYSLICCQGAYVACDIGSDRSGVLHVAHDWLWLLCPYALVRTVILTVVKGRAAPSGP